MTVHPRARNAPSALLHEETFDPVGTFPAYADEDELPGTPYDLVRWPCALPAAYMAYIMCVQFLGEPLAEIRRLP